MKILFIEADNYLDSNQESFYQSLKKDGHDVELITGCYDRVNLLAYKLKNWKPDVIMVQTTFVYADKFVVFDPLFKLIDYPIELWYSGIDPQQMPSYIPDDKKRLFTFFDVWMDVYDEPTHTNNWKRPIDIN